MCAVTYDPAAGAVYVWTGRRRAVVRTECTPDSLPCVFAIDYDAEDEIVGYELRNVEVDVVGEARGGRG